MEELTVFRLFVGSLACYRLTVFITRDYGPWGMFAKFRKIDRCSRLLQCPFCVSVYMGVGVCLGYACNIALIRWTFIALAFSAIAVLVDRTFTSDIRND